MCQVRADASEKERDFRSKQQSLQKAHGEQMEQLKVGGMNVILCRFKSLLL